VRTIGRRIRTNQQESENVDGGDFAQRVKRSDSFQPFPSSPIISGKAAT
jgi:hypothetical protein